MSKSKLSIVTIIALSAGIMFAATDMASAAQQRKAKKLTYEQAWAVCMKDVRANLPGDTTQSAARYTRGAGCMLRYGYRI